MPTSVDPVKDSAFIFSFPLIASPIVLPGPVTILMTPAGTPAASNNSIILILIKEVLLAGLKTTVLPALIAGAILQIPIPKGKLYGAITATTPSGSLSV